MTLAPDTKPHMKTYMNGLAWLLLNIDCQEVELIQKVTAKVEAEEKWLLEHGISQKQLEIVLDRAEKFIKTPLDQMTDEQQLLMCKLIFGTGTTMSKENLKKVETSQKALFEIDNK